MGVGWLEECGVDTVAMESTGVYWIPLLEILEDRGLQRVSGNIRMSYLKLVVIAPRSLVRSKATLRLENLALRQQLAVLKRQSK